jgi:antitoxin HicB
MNLMKYSMKIEWSEEDNCYVVFLPEFTKAMQPVSDGKTYMEAAQNGGDALESIVASYLLVASALRNRTHDVMGQIEYDSILPLPHLGNKDRSVSYLVLRPSAITSGKLQQKIVKLLVSL